MFNDDEWRKLPKIGRIHCAIRANSKDDKHTWVLQLATRVNNGHVYGPPIGPVFTSRKEALEYRRKYVYKNQSVKGGFIPDPNAVYPLFADYCGHIRYRDNHGLCIEPTCKFAAYQTP